MSLADARKRFTEEYAQAIARGEEPQGRLARAKAEAAAAAPEMQSWADNLAWILSSEIDNEVVALEGRQSAHEAAVAI